MHRWPTHPQEKEEEYSVTSLHQYSVSGLVVSEKEQKGSGSPSDWKKMGLPRPEVSTLGPKPDDEVLFERKTEGSVQF